MLHGCRRGSPPTIVVMRLSKNRSVCYGFNGRGDFTASAALSADQGGGHRVVPGSYRSTSSTLQVPGVTRGLSGGTDTRGVAPTTSHRLNTGEAAPAALSGFRTVAGRGSS